MKNTASGEPAGDQTKPWSSSGGCKGLIGNKPAVVIAVLFLGVAVSGLVLFNSTSYLWSSIILSASSHGKIDMELEKVLKRAANPNKTVIITTSNQAWAAPNSIIDIFLESFSKGNGTKRLLDNLVIVLPPRTPALLRDQVRRCEQGTVEEGGLLHDPGLLEDDVEKDPFPN